MRKFLEEFLARVLERVPRRILEITALEKLFKKIHERNLPRTFLEQGFPDLSSTRALVQIILKIISQVSSK